MDFYHLMIFKVIIIKFLKVILKLIKKEEEETRIELQKQSEIQEKNLEEKDLEEKILNQKIS